ncbi:MAG: biopolymer transporter ExbD [Saprospiraceae bacterium]|jgi:biopolymer transport protein ExbD|nr:biopolymer transporter ExbD [Saprospiraceae bacterium]MDP4700534.1 biopolymer transporter ExbD [Saprospiraceae bacterium]MDP4810154.1 biopolymer transporter ExbD [Saprospiraceae bacterium]MDP4814379.1 biopolymer transporter ExbD [Saprospiraceae bacterium]MDP4853673.1 biopolymer transporter ExbD [Saprospiraceae bacterium]
MSKFSKGKKKSSPGINTASLPDIVFMLLFFFMVVTKLRDSELMVKVTTPFATQLTKLEDKSLVNYLYIGRPVEKYKATYGTKPRLQLGDKFANINEIPIFLERFRVKIAEVQRTKITTSLRVDGQVTMGIVQDVKTELRKANQLKINYSAKKKPE